MTTVTISKDMEARTFTVNELRVERAKDGDNEKPPTLRGHAAMFNQIGDGGWFEEQIAPGAFENSLKEDDIRAVFNHNPDIVLGRKSTGTLELREDDKGLAVTITPPDTQYIRDKVLAPIERGDISQMSFGFQTIREEWQFKEEEDEGKDLRTLLEVKLFEVSPVTFPFYEGTDIAVRSHQESKDRAKAGEKPAPWRVRNMKRKLKLNAKKEDI